MLAEDLATRKAVLRQRFGRSAFGAGLPELSFVVRSSPLSSQFHAGSCLSLKAQRLEWLDLPNGGFRAIHQAGRELGCLDPLA